MYRSLLRRMRNIADKICREKQNTRCTYTHLVFNKLSSEILAIYERMSKNMADLDRPPMTVIRRIRFRAGYLRLQTPTQNNAFQQEL